MTIKIFLVSLISLFIIHSTLFSQTDNRIIHFGKWQVGYTLNRLTLSVDSRLILLNVMQELCGNSDINRDSSRYLTSIRRHFEKYKSHRLINLIRSIYREGINLEIPYEVMLSLNYDFEPDTSLINPNYKSIHRNLDTADLFVKYVREFAEETDFNNFFNESIPYYDGILKKQISEIAGFDGVTTLEDFYGSKHGGYNIFIVPLDYGSKGVSLSKKDGTDEVFFICGIGQLKENEVLGRVHFSQLFWHEFGHTFVNSITYKYKNIVDKYARCYDAISKVSEQGYGRWANALNEQIIRATEVLFTEIKYGKNEAEKALRQEERNNFFYTDGIRNSLKHYAANRNKFRTYEDYFPLLLKSLETIDISGVKNNFIPTLRYFEIDSSIVIIPSDVDKSIRQNVYDYINTYYDKKLKTKNCSILIDTTALKSDLTKSNLIVFGSPSSNKWLGKYFDQLPFILSDSAIAGSKVIRGNNLRLLSTWINPQNPNKHIVVFTAFDLSNLIGIERWIPGFMLNYAIFDDNKLKDYGNYYKQNDRWAIESK